MNDPGREGVKGKALGVFILFILTLSIQVSCLLSKYEGLSQQQEALLQAHQELKEQNHRLLKELEKIDTKINKVSMKEEMSIQEPLSKRDFFVESNQRKKETRQLI